MRLDNEGGKEMNYFEALRLVGHFPVVEGFWRNVSMAAGLVGVTAMLFLTMVFEIFDANWLSFSITIVFLIMAILPLYLPR